MKNAVQIAVDGEMEISSPPEAANVALLTEIRALRQELRTLSNPTAGASSASPSEPLTLKVSLDRIVGERKPFILRCHGAFNFEVKVSTMRAALLLALLLDLQDRISGGGRLTETMNRMMALYRALDGTSAADEQVASLVRVGLYRLELSLVETKLFQGTGMRLRYNSQLHRLDLDEDSVSRRLSDLTISIASSDPKVLGSLDSLSGTSPLVRARQQKSMYISSTERGWDQLFLEFFEHTLPVKNTSLFYRPALATFPDELLRATKASGASITRKRVMLEGYKSGRVGLHEILNRQTIWDMITTAADGSYGLYPPGATAELVTMHLEELRSQLERYEPYQLSLTDAVFPFIVGVVEIGEEASRDAFTMFYRQPTSKQGGDLTCFVLHDPLMAQSMVSKVISTVLEHPSTVTDRETVREELAHVIDYFKTHGPIVRV